MTYGTPERRPYRHTHLCLDDITIARWWDKRHLHTVGANNVRPLKEEPMLTQDNAVFLFIDFQERMMPAIHDNEKVTRNALILAKGARLLNQPSLITRQYPKGLGDTIPEIMDALADADNTDKTAFSCVGDEEFRKKLAATEKKNVVVAGVETHICVQQTVLELLEAGYGVYLAADCCGSRGKADSGYAEWRMALAGAKMTTAETILFEIMRDKDHPARKSVQELIK